MWKPFSSDVGPKISLEMKLLTAVHAAEQLQDAGVTSGTLKDSIRKTPTLMEVMTGDESEVCPVEDEMLIS